MATALLLPLAIGISTSETRSRALRGRHRRGFLAVRRGREYRRPVRSTRFGFRTKLVQRVGDLEPRSFEVYEDVALRPNSRIVFEGTGRDTDDLAAHDRHRSATHGAECPLIPWRSVANWRFVGLDEGFPTNPCEFTGSNSNSATNADPLAARQREQ